MDSLYKQVFSNKYLNSYIFSCVQNIEFNGNFQTTYNEIENSFNIVDLEIGVLLKKRKYELLSKMIDNYFNKLVGVQDSKPLLWYYVLNPNKNEIKRLLRWSGLGFNRFKLMYDEFKQVFESIGKELIKNAFIGGNYEIVQFLIQQGYPLNIDIQFVNSEIGKFNCGGNIKLFEMIMDSLMKREIELSNYDKQSIVIAISSLMTNQYKNHYKPVINYNYHNKQTHERNVWIMESPSTSFKYYGIFKLLLSGIVTHYSIKLLWGICFKQGNLSLGKALIDIINEYNIINPLVQQQKTSPLNNYSKSSIIYNAINNMFDQENNLVFSDESFDVIKYVFENYNGNGHNKIEDALTFVSCSTFEIGKKIYRLHVENQSDDELNFESIIGSCLDNQQSMFIPNSIQEFKFIENNSNLIKLFHDILRPHQVLVHIAMVARDLEYLKYVISYYRKEEFALPSATIMLDSSYEIVSWLLTEYWDPSDHSQYDNYKFSFNGNMKVVELVESSNIQIHGNRLIEVAIKENYYPLFLHAIKSMGLQEFEHPIHSAHHFNRFDMFKCLLDKINLSSFDIVKSTRVNSLHVLNPLFLSYWFSIRQQQETPTQLILKSIYLYNGFNFINDSKSNSSLEYNTDNVQNLRAIQFNSTKVLGYLISNSGASLLDNIFENKFIISNLVRFNSKKFIYLLNLKGIGNLSNETLKYIILQSILSNNYLVLYYIANNGDGCDQSEFKNKFYQYFLLYSIFTINKKKFKQNSNGITLSLISSELLYNYYNSDCVSLDKFNSDFSNLISIENISKSRLLINFDSFLKQQQTNIQLNNFLKMIIKK